PGEAHRVRMVCLDDDDPGRPLEVLWELELGAQVLRPDQELPAALRALDEPRHFAAYLHALKWNCVTASDGELFQAPFRAGIALSAYQLTPLLKALELPRANLFIADDVGLGKTIEAGLVLQELLLRQRVDYVLVVAPPAVCLQWQGEMARRFGLAFEVHDRAFVARRRRERGFGVNPWATHNRFIISYPLLRRPEYLEPLLAHLAGRGKRKTLLILDEAHTVAPATASHYAVDSRITRIVRDALAPAFENRLFLSATPHNGHSNSFSALLEILDPQRFTRGVRISGPEALRPVMVRRLKRDIRHLADTDLPERRVPELLLWRDGDRWLADLSEHDPTAPAGAEPPRDPPVDLGPAPPLELELAALLREYSALIGARTRRQRLVFINLQKRLLSSIAAFHRTLGKHALTFDQTLAPLLAQGELGLDLDTDPDTDSALAPELDDDLDPSDRALADADDAAVEAGTRELKADRRDISADARARALLEQMLRKAAEGRALPDARVRALVAWIRRHMCPAAGFEAPPASTSRAWSERRIIVFTESLDTKRYLRQMLRSALRHAGDADDRIMELHGAMADDRREAIQRAFNAPPAEHPVRILLATDAAREGINLQGACADLIHFDIPWNPARMEQRNGRIDRTLQPADVVRCAYFRYRDRPEDLVLAAVIRKVATIHHELGSLGAVIQDQVAELLEGEGIDADTAARLEAATALGGRGEVVRRELDDAADDRERAQIRREIARASKILHRSRQLLDFDNAL
ncbi:MAG: DISARM system SNF2-like helicase DrmD, partial [Myxococcales bacterium]|nr:DISARM system SNF2-like helicase DrmD [Myxococcales bacterium]